VESGEVGLGMVGSCLAASTDNDGFEGVDGFLAVGAEDFGSESAGIEDDFGA
jgi:hypothetical protein